MYNSPQEFLDELKKLKLCSMPDHKISDSACRKIKGKLKKHGHGLTFKDDPLEVVLKLCVDKALSGLSSEDRQTVNEKIAFDISYTSEINAGIYRSECGYYAIILNRGFMLFYNFFLRLFLTQCLPEKTRYIDKETKRLFEDGGYEAIYESIRKKILKYRNPFIGKIVPIPEINSVVAILLHFGETFALCHELGHFFNGDFEESFSSGLFTSPSSGISHIKHSYEHKIEFLADLSGYEIFRKAYCYDRPELSVSIVTLFDSFFVLDDSENPSHPHPIRRMLNIIYNFYGKEEAYDELGSYEGDPKDNDFIQKMKNFIEELDETPNRCFDT